MEPRNEDLFKPRIVLTRDMREAFFEKVFKGNVPRFSADKGLPYDLVYNLVHGRIRSLSADEYRVIFGEEPPCHSQQRVDARYFTGMVKLWLFLHPQVTEADLYREFRQGQAFKKIDYRVFAGDKIRSVDGKVERWMEQKLISQGFQRKEIEEGIAELETAGYGAKLPYGELRSTLEYIEKKLGVSATKMLKQWAARYESGELKNVPKDIYDRAVKVEGRAKSALESGSRYELEKVKEEIYGARKGYVLFSEVEKELRCLKTYGRRSLKAYLGRSIKNYEQAKLKRIAASRVKRTRDDFKELMCRSQDLI